MARGGAPFILGLTATLFVLLLGGDQSVTTSRFTHGLDRCPRWERHVQTTFSGMVVTVTAVCERTATNATLALDKITLKVYRPEALNDFAGMVLKDFPPMKSSTGFYYVGLDHLRALAAYMVFVWHFIHGPIPYGEVSNFIPLSLLTEGHTGVALFMTLSGYLFAKILDQRDIYFWRFLWNRVVRLLPLLLIALLLLAADLARQGQLDIGFIKSIFKGIVLPSLPQGGWSITVEFHFYLLIPFFLMLKKRDPKLLLLVLALAIMLRIGMFLYKGQIQSLAYWTLIGRVDQFLLGMLGFYYSVYITRKHLVAGVILTCFAVFFWIFSLQGGFFKMPAYPSPSAIWIVMPTFEGIAYATLIAYYDNSFILRRDGLSGIIAKIGECSYSIYLLHFFFVSRISARTAEYVNGIWSAVALSTIVFVLLIPVFYASFKYIELPFLRFRTNYFRAHSSG